MSDTIMVVHFERRRFTPSRNAPCFDRLRSGMTDAQKLFERELNDLETTTWHWASPRPWRGPHALRGNREGWNYGGRRYHPNNVPQDTCWWAGSWAGLGVKAGRAWALKRSLKMVVKGDSLSKRQRRREDGHEGWDWERGTLRHSSSSGQKEMMFW